MHESCDTGGSCRRICVRYDEVELLRPAKTDRFTDYRYHRGDQLPTVCRITALRNRGFLLADKEGSEKYFAGSGGELKRLSRDTAYKLTILSATPNQFVFILPHIRATTGLPNRNRDRPRAIRNNGKGLSGLPCRGTPDRSFFRFVRPLYQADKPADHPIEHAGDGAVGNDRPGDGEQLCPHPQNEALCLCQDRTHNFFAFLEFYDSVQR